MANRWHVFRLWRGVQAWNAWRKAHPEVRPSLADADLQGADLTSANLFHADLTSANLFSADLSRADLSGADLSQASFSHAKLSGADLSGADLSGADLSHAKLAHARLTWADLSGADLSRADLSGADLSHAKLSGVDLSGVDLSGADLSGVDLQECQFDGARIRRTIFADMDLRGVHGLDTIHHEGPSTIGIDTLYKSRGDIPEIFLRGCGVPDSMIEYARALVAAERPIDYYSCFISYSHADAALAERLHADLQARGVRCWYAPHDMQIGEPILSGIDRGIRLHDKLLLILSAAAVESAWIEQEVEMALARERTERRRVLFPIRIDDAVSAHTAGWPALVWSQRHVGDFRQWTEYAAYQESFARLLHDLKAEKK